MNDKDRKAASTLATMAGLASALAPSGSPEPQRARTKVHYKGQKWWKSRKARMAMQKSSRKLNRKLQRRHPK